MLTDYRNFRISFEFVTQSNVSSDYNLDVVSEVVGSPWSGCC